MKEELYTFDESIQYSEDFYEFEYEALTNKYEKAKNNALKCREDYSKMCDRFKKYFLIGIGIILLYNFTIRDFLMGYKNTLPEIFYNIIIFFSIFWRWILIYPYFLFLISRLLCIFLNGKSSKAKWLAAKINYMSLTVLAEEYDNEAIYLENQLKKLEKYVTDTKFV